MFVHVCPCFFMFVHVCSCLFMFVHVCSCLSMFVHVCPCLSMEEPEVLLKWSWTVLVLLSRRPEMVTQEHSPGSWTPQTSFKGVPDSKIWLNQRWKNVSNDIDSTLKLGIEIVQKVQRNSTLFQRWGFNHSLTLYQRWFNHHLNGSLQAHCSWFYVESRQDSTKI